jgi:hypothetical protein
MKIRGGQETPGSEPGGDSKAGKAPAPMLPSEAQLVQYSGAVNRKSQDYATSLHHVISTPDGPRVVEVTRRLIGNGDQQRLHQTEIREPFPGELKGKKNGGEEEPATDTDSEPPHYEVLQVTTHDTEEQKAPFLPNRTVRTPTSVYRDEGFYARRQDGSWRRVSTAQTNALTTGNPNPHEANADDVRRFTYLLRTKIRRRNLINRIP